jgi:hypothetical protein
MENRRGTCRVVVGRCEGKKTLGRPRPKWEQILKLIFKNSDSIKKKITQISHFS